MLVPPTSLRRELDIALSRRKFLTSQIEEERARLEAAKAEVATVQEAQTHLQAIAQEIQTRAHRQVAEIVSKCLTTVFESPYELRIEFERKRGRTEAEFVYLRDGRKVMPRVTSGGVREVAALALRLSSLLLSQPPARRVLFLDEAFAGLSEGNLQKLARLLETLSKELNLQLILCTHDTALQIGKVVHLPI